MAYERVMNQYNNIELRLDQENALYNKCNTSDVEIRDYQLGERDNEINITQN